MPAPVPRLLLLLSAVLALAGPAPGQDALRVATKEAPPFAMRGDDGWTGLSIELWEKIAADLELDYAFEEAPLDAMLDGVAGGEFSAAVAALSVTAEREERLDFSHPFHTSGLGIAVAPEGGSGLAAFFANLASWRFVKVVLALLGLLAAIGVVIWLLERRRNPQFAETGARGVGAGIWWSAVTMTTVGYGDKAPLSLGGRALAMVWMFASLILVATFTAAMASSLTVNQLGSEIAGPEDLPGRRVATVAGSTSESYLRDAGIGHRAYASAAEAAAAVARGDADAAVYDEPLLRHLALTELQGEIAVLPRVFQRQDYAIALPADSPLRERVNQALLAHVSSAWWQSRLRRYLGR